VILREYWQVFAVHLFCQVVYSLFVIASADRAFIKFLWLLLIWGVPILGIGTAGARFARLGPRDG
jgi:hypothetical protein